MLVLKSLSYEIFLSIKWCIVRLWSAGAINMFITYKVNIENQLNKNVKILKSDWDGEYESNEFN